MRTRQRKRIAAKKAARAANTTFVAPARAPAPGIAAAAFDEVAPESKLTPDAAAFGAHIEAIAAQYPVVVPDPDRELAFEAALSALSRRLRPWFPPSPGGKRP